MDPSQQWQNPQQGQPGPQYPPQQGQPQYPQQPAPPQYPVQPPQQYPAQPPPQYPNQQYSAAPYNIAPNSAAPYSGPPATGYQPPLPTPPRRGNRVLPLLVIAAALLVVMAVAVVIVQLTKSDDKKVDPSAAPTSQAGPVDTCLVGKWNQTSFQKVVDFAGTDIEKRETIGKVKMTGAGTVWTINADGSATQDDSKFVYSGKDDTGRTITATFSGTADWQLKTVGRTIEYAGKESNTALVITVDGRKAGTITLEPNLDPSNYTCVGDVWRSSDPKDSDTFSRYDRIK